MLPQHPPLSLFYLNCCCYFIAKLCPTLYDYMDFSLLGFWWAAVYGVAQSCTRLKRLSGSSSSRLLCPWHFLVKNTGVGYHFLIQGIFLTLGSNPGLLHYRQILY